MMCRGSSRDSLDSLPRDSLGATPSGRRFEPLQRITCCLPLQSRCRSRLKPSRLRLCRKGKLSMFKKGRSPYSSADDTSPTGGKQGDLAAVMGKGVLPGTLTSVGPAELDDCSNRNCCSICHRLMWCCRETAGTWQSPEACSEIQHRAQLQVGTGAT